METNGETGPVRRKHQKINAQIHAPFDRLDEEAMKEKIEKFLLETELQDYRQHFLKGAFIAQNDRAFSSSHDDGLMLTDDEKECLRQESENRWKHPGALWQLVALCAVGAAVQGWDESAIDGGKISRQISSYHLWSFRHLLVQNS